MTPVTEKPVAVPRVGVGVIVRRGDRVLLIQRRGDHGGGTWSTPGGHLEHGEAPEDCAIREVVEEVGVTITDVQFCGITNDVFAESGKHYITIWMQGRIVPDGAAEPVIASPREVAQTGWFAWDALPEPLFVPLANFVAGHMYR